MEEIRLIIDIKALPYYKAEFKSDPYISYEAIAGNDNFVMLIIDEAIMLDIEKIAAAAESFGFQQGFDAGLKHAGL